MPAVTFGLTVKVLNDETGLPQPLLTVYVISDVPALTALTTPVAGITVATDVFVLLQLPPEVPLLVYVTITPIQSGDVPLTVPALTFGDTVSVLNDDTVPPHPLTVYVILAVPALNALTTPVPGITVATDVFVLLQVPPAVPLLVYVAVVPIQSGEVPLTAPALTSGLTVSDVDTVAVPQLLVTE